MVVHDIWWQVYPLGACGAPIRGDHGEPQPRLRRLEAWLDYIIELGCNGLLLNPIFASTSHGYDTLDYYRIDPRLGSAEDFDQLIAQARSRGIQIMLDGVFNHVSKDHPWVRQRPELIRFIDDQPQGWEGHSDLVELNHDHPAVVDEITNVMLHWLRRGISGWRLDVAYAVPTSFWREVGQRVRAEFPHAILLGEVIHGNYTGFIEQSGLTSLTQYELWKALWSSLKDVNAWELAHALERHRDFCQSFIPNTFIGNHDVTRIATTLPSHQVMLTPYLLMTLPGMPSIYYGDEQGFTGLKVEDYGGDDQVRPPLPETPAELSTLGAGILRHYQAAIALRRRNPWLATGQIEVVHKTNEMLVYRVSGDGKSLEVHTNIATGWLELKGAEQLTVQP